jgi:hypothetical protein
MRLVRSNSGNSFSYAPANPPDIRTLTAPIDIFVSLADSRLGTTLAMSRLQQGFTAGEIALRAHVAECPTALNATEQIG